MNWFPSSFAPLPRLLCFCVSLYFYIPNPYWALLSAHISADVYWTRILGNRWIDFLLHLLLFRGFYIDSITLWTWIMETCGQIWEIAMICMECVRWLDACVLHIQILFSYIILWYEMARCMRPADSTEYIVKDWKNFLGRLIWFSALTSSKRINMYIYEFLLPLTVPCVKTEIEARTESSSCNLSLTARRDNINHFKN